ncbi:SDR family NAD(P)-dependent oxidoreductase [Nocardia sp. CA2R105]|uniref:SDR family NAD(P)-dependent oxidoreductase n=1 Tax=Nocardia coffeae TaxID=2873381 RepID=UPI001CA66DAA|nr:SDR family NAD(P)-dependent oxidoreductase [Nocardia coffeae]MBY8856826.1 SDR family NAD(P)-dependent oxidoreductase [Nocardia coffeae]
MQDKVVIVTGGSSGLGRATAEIMISERARVVLTDVDHEAGHAISDAIGADFVLTDVSDPAAVDLLVSSTEQRFGRLDVMCNNAGVFTGTPFLETSDADLDRLISVNFKGVFYGTRAAGRVMTAQGFGAIINTASKSASPGRR